MMDWYGEGGMGAGSIFLMILFWAIIIGLGIWLVTRLTQKDGSRIKEESPKQILDRRFALGEIDAPTYAQARRLLDGHPLDSGNSK